MQGVQLRSTSKSDTYKVLNYSDRYIYIYIRIYCRHYPHSVFNNNLKTLLTSSSAGMQTVQSAGPGARGKSKGKLDTQNHGNRRWKLRFFGVCEKNQGTPCWVTSTNWKIFRPTDKIENVACFGLGSISSSWLPTPPCRQLSNASWWLWKNWNTNGCVFHAGRVCLQILASWMSYLVPGFFSSVPMCPLNFPVCYLF